MNITNPLQPLPFGVSQYGVGFGGINPMVSQLAHPYVSNPIAALSGIGVNPYTLGQTQYVHPLLVAQLASTNPTLLPLLAQQSAIGQSPYGIQSMLQPQLGQIGSPFQQFGQFGAGIGPWGNPFSQGVSPFLQQGWGQQFGSGIGQLGGPFGSHPFAQQAFGYPALQQGLGWGAPTLFNSPVPGVDPITGALTAQQSSLLAHGQLPIRPLIAPQQPDPFQMSALSWVMTGQAADPYSALTQPSPILPLGVNPIHQGLRQPAGSPQSGFPF
jgi:hypothetical protein